MRWKLEFSEDASRDFSSLDHPLRRRVAERLDWLLDNVERIIPLPLTGAWKGFFKFRAGDIRIIYSIQQERRLIRIEYIDRRDKIYKRRG